MSSFSAAAYMALGQQALARTKSINTNSAPQAEISNIRNADGLRMFLIGNGATDDRNMTFYFPYSPAQMQINDLSSTYVEINRPKMIPIVEFAGHKLMKFQIEFLLSHIGNGVSMPVDDHIEFLRRMATSKQGIAFADGNKLLTSPLTYKGVAGSTTTFFYITDMSINAQRMTYDNKGIAVASVSLSFTETRNPILSVVQMPKIKYTKTTPRGKGSKTNPKGKKDVKLSAGGIAGGVNAKGKVGQKKGNPKAPKVVKGKKG